VSFQVIVYILTALAAVVVVLTRVRLGRGGGGGTIEVGSRLLGLHTVAGGLALITWLAFLFAPDDSAFGGDLMGVLALLFWWLTVAAGLLILVRWLPSRGKHASAQDDDEWSEGPGLSVLAHVGMLVGVVVFTYYYAKPPS
jgi:hypothetical protein